MASHRKLLGKAWQTRVRLLSSFKLVLFSLIRFSSDLESTLSSWSREGDTLANRFLDKCKFPFQRVTSLFSEWLLCLLFLIIISSKNSLCRRGAYFGVAYSATLHRLSVVLHLHARLMLFLLNSLIEVKLTYDKSYPFKTYNSPVFTVFTEFCSYHHNVTPSSPQKETSCPSAVIARSLHSHSKP